MKSEVIEKLTNLITAAFGLVAALAWNTAIQTLFKNIFGEQNSVPAMIYYATFVTIVAVVFTLWLGRLADKAKQPLREKLFGKKKAQELRKEEKGKK